MPANIKQGTYSVLDIQRSDNEIEECYELKLSSGTVVSVYRGTNDSIDFDRLKEYLDRVGHISIMPEGD